ncbi:hypothetical protein NIES4071_40060 [Calothrix sp. NIES-4071]|nr:hypothetical protein NIES4071_40060 [Calothrix sp. NIES-4071]BAZ58324.1 hypothetical protein NIES4105_40000 [Calothrix sp. NIES-4105]
MSKQTSFNIEDAEKLLTQLQQLNEIIQQDWSRVLNQWNNLEQTWQDDSYDDFQTNFQKIVDIYKDEQNELEQHIAFIKKQIEAAQNLNQLGILNK